MRGLRECIQRGETGIAFQPSRMSDDGMSPKSLRYALRPLVETDHDAVAEVWHSSASLPSVGVPVMPTLPEMRHRIDVEIDAGWLVTVAASENIIIGFVAIKPREAVLAELFVRPGLTGGGVGRALLARAMVSMPDGFTLYTRAANVRARHFYEKAGMVFLREDLHPRAGDPVVYYGWKSAEYYNVDKSTAMQEPR